MALGGRTKKYELLKSRADRLFAPANFPSIDPPAFSSSLPRTAEVIGSNSALISKLDTTFGEADTFDTRISFSLHKAIDRVKV
jgi:hypothetical protein